jgi:hypothetical protein
MDHPTSPVFVQPATYQTEPEQLLGLSRDLFGGH